MPDTERHLKVVVDAEDQASSKLKSVSASLKDVGKIATVAGAAIVTELGFAVKAAAEAQQQMAQVNIITSKLGDVAKKAGTDVAGLQAQFVATGKAAVRLGFDDEAVALATARLAQSTGDLKSAQQGVQLSMDLSRAKGLELEQATNAINLALQGSPKLLRQFGIELEDNATKAEILAALQAKLGGTSEQMANSFAIQAEVLKVQFGNIQEQIGGALIPILSDLLSKYIVPLIEKFIAFSEAHPTLFKNMVLIVAAVGGLLAVLGPLLIMLPTLITLFTVLTGPIGLVFLAIVALIAIGVALIANWDTIKEKGLSTWGLLKDGIMVVIDALKAAFNAFMEFFKGIWENIKNIAINAISPIIDKIQSLISLAQRAASAVSGVAGGIGRAVSAPFRKFQEGGIVTQPTMGLVGEAGPEAVIPLRKAGSMGGITVNINGGTFLSEDVAVEIGDMIVNRLKMNLRIIS